MENSSTTAPRRVSDGLGKNASPPNTARTLGPETTRKPCIRPLSMRAGAIAGFCRACGYDPGARETWREQVVACPAADCALHRFRPLPRDVAPGSPALAALRLRLAARSEAHDGPC